MLSNIQRGVHCGRAAGRYIQLVRQVFMTNLSNTKKLHNKVQIHIFLTIQSFLVAYSVGVYLLGVYFMIAAGFWFHELENLSIDGELESDKLHDQTSIMYPQFGSSH